MTTIWNSCSRLDRACVAVLGMAIAIVLMALWASGALLGTVAPDTVTYFQAFHSANPWGEMRHPLYGMLASWLGGNEHEPGHIVLIQVLLAASAPAALYAGARSGGLGGLAALSLSLAALSSQSGLFHVRLVLPESSAITCLLLAFAGVFAAGNSARAYHVLVVPIGLAVGLAYIFRPSFLPAIFCVPALWWALAMRSRLPGRAARAALLFTVAIAPFALQSGYRWKVVGDFNIVSFGGYQMSGMAGLMLSPQIVAALPDAVRPTAQAVLSGREAAEAAGRVARTPLNSSGERSFVSAALGYFDIYARTYDDLLYGEINKLRASDESWVAFNARLQRFSFATVTAAPREWLAWSGGATSRLVGRTIITDVPMLLALAALTLVGLPACVARTRLGSSASDLPVVCLAGLAWLGSTAPLIVLVTFPATRYVDTSAVLLPAVPALLAAAIVQGRQRRFDGNASSA